MKIKFTASGFSDNENLADLLQQITNSIEEISVTGVAIFAQYHSEYQGEVKTLICTVSFDGCALCTVHYPTPYCLGYSVSADIRRVFPLVVSSEVRSHL